MSGPVTGTDGSQSQGYDEALNNANPADQTASGTGTESPAPEGNQPPPSGTGDAGDGNNLDWIYAEDGNAQDFDADKLAQAETLDNANAYDDTQKNAWKNFLRQVGLAKAPQDLYNLEAEYVAPPAVDPTTPEPASTKESKKEDKKEERKEKKEQAREERENKTYGVRFDNVMMRNARKILRAQAQQILEEETDESITKKELKTFIQKQVKLIREDVKQKTFKRQDGFVKDAKKTADQLLKELGLKGKEKMLSKFNQHADQADTKADPLDEEAKAEYAKDGKVVEGDEQISEKERLAQEKLLKSAWRRGGSDDDVASLRARRELEESEKTPSTQTEVAEDVAIHPDKSHILEKVLPAFVKAGKFLQEEADKIAKNIISGVEHVFKSEEADDTSETDILHDVIGNVHQFVDGEEGKKELEHSRSMLLGVFHLKLGGKQGHAKELGRNANRLRFGRTSADQTTTVDNAPRLPETREETQRLFGSKYKGHAEKKPEFATDFDLDSPVVEEFPQHRMRIKSNRKKDETSGKELRSGDLSNERN